MRLDFGLAALLGRRALMVCLAVAITTSLALQSAEAKPLLETRSEKKQCKEIEPWLSYFDDLSGRKILTTENTFPDNMVSYEFTYRTAPMFTDKIFVLVMGKSYFDLTDADSRTIRYAITRCSSGMGTYQFLIEALQKQKFPQSDWYREILEAQQDPRSIQAQMEVRAKTKDAEIAQQAADTAKRNAQRERQKQARARPKRVNPYAAGELVLDTPRARIHLLERDTHNPGDHCRNNAYMDLSIVLKDPNYRVTEASTRKLIADYLADLKNQHCPNAYQVNAEFYFENVFLNQQGQEVSAAQAGTGRYFAVARYTGKYDMPETLNIEYFNAMCTPHIKCETMAEFRDAASRDFLTPEAYAEQQRIEAERARKRAEQDRLRADLGLTIDSTEIWMLIVGGAESKSYFEDRRSTILTNGAITKPIFAYAYATNDYCKTGTPNGTTTAVYTQTDSWGNETNRVELIVPKDIFPAMKFYINADRVWPQRRDTDEYNDIEKLLSQKGCNSGWHKRFHESIKQAVHTAWP